jgi:hypothetical protein
MLASVGTKSAERLRRYEAGHSLDLHRSLNALAKLRKEADARPTDIDAGTWGADTTAPAPNEPKAGPEPEAPNEPKPGDEAPAPNEPKPAKWIEESPCGQTTSGDTASPDSPDRPGSTRRVEPHAGPSDAS